MSTEVSLEDSELIVLDGRCTAEVQEKVNAAKDRISMAKTLQGSDPKIAGFVADVVSEAKKNGLLRHAYCRLRTCKICGQTAGYYVYSRNGRNHRKGQPDYNHPKYLSGVELADRFISMQGYATLGCCNACFEKALPLLKSVLKDVRAQIPESLSGLPTRFKRFDRRKCKKCGWIGHEGEMRQLRTLMGDGYYPGGCPKCENESSLFNNSFERVEGCDVIEVVKNPA